MDGKKAVEVTQNVFGRSLVPFTGGVIVFFYAFFWPESYATWLGTMVRVFRTTSGL